MALTVTPGGASDDSYISLADADAFFANTLRQAAWDAVTDANKELALRQATDEIERAGGSAPHASLPSRTYFPGVPYDLDTPQALHFPTTVDVDDDGATVVPQAIKDAVCEQAAWLLAVAGPGGVSSGSGGVGSSQSGDDGLAPHGLLQSLGVESWSMDGQQFTYGKSKTDPYKPDWLAPSAWSHLRPYVVRGRAHRLRAR